MLCRNKRIILMWLNIGINPRHFMFLKLIYFSTFLILPLILLAVNFFVITKNNPSRNLLSRFECGFDRFINARTPFSLHFFLIRIIFLVFDLEIIFLIPLPLWISRGKTLIIFVSILFILILFLGTLHEFNEGSLEWF